MKINLNLLPINIDEDIIIPRDYYEKLAIDSIDNVHVIGKIFNNLSDEVEFDLTVTGIMKLKDAITLEIIDKEFDFKIEDNLENLISDSTYFYEKNKNILDIIEFLWENIVLEVPISVTNSSGKTIKGDGWSLNDESGNEEINEEFLKLNDIYKGGE